MLTFLRVRNFAIVRDLTLRLGPGLNVLTGETGAGKSILVDALGIALGDRASAELVRAGEESARVEAVFRLEGDPAGDAVRAFFDEIGLPAAEDEVLVRREVELGGGAGTGTGARSRQFINDAPVALGTLRRFGDLVVEIQGQHEHHALLNEEAQREALDRFAGAAGDREELAGLARAANAASREVLEIEDRVRDRESKLDYLRFQAAELDALRPSAADETDLRALKARLLSAGRRMEIANRVYQALYESDAAVLTAIGSLFGDLRRLHELDPGGAPALEPAEEARRSLEDLAGALRSYTEEEEADPARLEAVEDRLADYERVSRKHGVPSADLEDLAGRLRSEIEDLERQEERRVEAVARAEAARQTWLAAARWLSSKRRGESERLATALRRELAALAMERCAVEIDVRTGEPAPSDPLPETGLDRIAFLISANPGEPPRALAAIASGGELCRAMLAVNVALGKGRRGGTLIFDEVDAGIGGRVAQAVGEKLRSLSSSHQVLVVTHLPQIASLADTHHAVEKKSERGRTVALVRELDRQGRIEELARMMGGREVSTVARRHAADMLKRSAERHERRTP